MSRVMMLPPKPNFWSSFLERFNPNQIAQGAMMGMEERRRREGMAAKVLQAVAENQIPLELIGTPEGQAMIKNLKIENMPGIQELLNGARQAATMRFPERQVTAPPPGMGGQPEPGPMAATPQLVGGPPTGPAMSIPAGQRPMTLPEAQVAAGQREFGIKMGQKEYENAMELKKYDTQKQIDLFYKQLGEKTPQQTVAWVRETMDAAKAAGLNIEGVNYEGLTAAGPFRETGRGMEQQKLANQQFQDYQSTVDKALNFKMTMVKYLTDMKTGKTGTTGMDIAAAIKGLEAPGSTFMIVPEGQYYKTPEERFRATLFQANRGIDDHNKVLSESAKQYRQKPFRLERINEELLDEMLGIESRTGKPFTDLIDSLGIGKLFEKAKAAVAGAGQPAVPKVPAAQYQEGQTATNPKTGQKLKYTNGQWVPIR